MAINRQAIEAHILASAAQLGIDKKFVAAAIDRLCEHFDAHGWPDQMPDFTVQPPIDNSPHGFNDGYAGYTDHLKNEGAMWRWPAGSNEWVR